MLRRVNVLRGAAAEGFKFCTERTNPGVGRTHDLHLDSGKGSYVTDADGKKYLDFTCGIGVTNLGHCHPRLVAAAKEQLEKGWHLQVCLGPHTALKRMLEQLETIFPAPLNNFSFVTTGAEALEAALKLSRQSTGRQNTVVLQGGYHGRTVGAQAMTTSKYGYSRGMRPLMPGITVVPIPYASQLKVSNTTPVDEMVDRCLAITEDLLHQTTHPSEVSMLVAEPVLGEGGYLPLPKRYYQGLRQMCTKYGILLCIDEVQTGFGRTGNMFMFEKLVDRDASGQLCASQLPDIVAFAKGIANGMPIAGIVTRNELAQKQLPGQMGGTYAANAIACATATEVMKIFKEDKIIENVMARGKQLVDGLKAITLEAKAPIAEVRGRGLMIGLQFDDRCAAGTAMQVSQAATKEGLLLLNTSKYETLRFIPPLNVTAAEIDEGLAKFRSALNSVMSTTNATVPRPSTFKPCCDAANCCSVVDGPCRHIAL